jgi:esterase/lipase superfamily enzyme
LPRNHSWTWIVAICSTAGCCAPGARDCAGIATPLGISADPAPLAQADVPWPIRMIGHAARGEVASAAVDIPSVVETWVVHTRACEQKIGADPWSSITIGRIEGLDDPIRGSDPETLLERMAGRPVVILIHGYGYIYRDAIEEAVKVRAELEAIGGLTPESLFIVFDWPSERGLSDFYADLNDKARRARVASYHLARFLQEAPPGSRVCLFGQSDGGRIALTTMHFLSGAVLGAFWSEPPVQLSSGRPDLRFRSVILAAAAGHHWLDPGERLDQALPACEALFNIRNSHDYALAFYVFGVYTGFRGALGRVGLDSHDFRRLGPLADRVEQVDVNPELGISHTTFSDALEIPDVGERIARYTSWSDLSVAAGH